MSPTEINRISKWVQFAMVVLSLLVKAIEALPSLIARTWRSRRRK